MIRDRLALGLLSGGLFRMNQLDDSPVGPRLGHTTYKFRKATRSDASTSACAEAHSKLPSAKRAISTCLLLPYPRL